MFPGDEGSDIKGRCQQRSPGFGRRPEGSVDAGGGRGSGGDGRRMERSAGARGLRQGMPGVGRCRGTLAGVGGRRQRSAGVGRILKGSGGS